MGTTAAITAFLAARRFYLIEMHQFDDTISQRFFVRITFCAVAGEAVDLGRLRGDFQAIAAAEELEWRVPPNRRGTPGRVLVLEPEHSLAGLLLPPPPPPPHKEHTPAGWHH